VSRFSNRSLKLTWVPILVDTLMQDRTNASIPDGLYHQGDLSRLASFPAATGLGPPSHPQPTLINICNLRKGLTAENTSGAHDYLPLFTASARNTATLRPLTSLRCSNVLAPALPSWLV